MLLVSGLFAFLAILTTLGQRLTMSLDGGLEGIKESLRAAAKSCSNRAISARVTVYPLE